MPTRLEWTDDPLAEQGMSNLDLTWEVKTVPAARVDLKLSHANQARLLAPIDPDTVERYVIGMSRPGAKFPRPVVLDRGKSPGVVMGGNHRLTAYWRVFPGQPFEAYVVQTTDAMIRDVLPRTLNVGHGLVPDRGQRVEHALHAVRTYGWSATRAAQEFEVPVTTIQAEIKAKRVTVRLIRLGAPPPAGKNKSILAALDRVGNDNVLSKLAPVVLAMQTTQAEQVIKEVLGKRTELAQLAAVAPYAPEAGEAAPAAAPAGRRPAPNKFVAQLKILGGMARKPSLLHLDVTDEKETARVETLLRSVAADLLRLAGG